MTFVKPLDEDILCEVMEKGCPVVTVEDGTVNGGLGTAVTEWFVAHNAPHIRVTKVGMPDDFVEHGSVAQLKKLCGMDAPAIAACAMALLSPVTEEDASGMRHKTQEL